MADKPTPTIPAIEFALATDRDDKGQTENYRVYAGGGQVQMKNKRGENVIKNAILGGNGTLYIANTLAGSHDAWVLIPRSVYQKLTGANASTAPAWANKKGGAKK